MLLGASDLVRGYWWLLPILLAAAVAFFIRARNEGRVRQWLDAAALRVPIVRDIVLYSNMARLARTMSILMRSGVHLLDTVAISARVLGNSRIRHSISGLASELRQGQRLSAALGGSKIVPQFMLRMLAVGEETGEVEQMLERVAERYEGDLRRKIRGLLSIFEPIVIVILGAIVGGIAITLFLAINDLRSGF
jgi:type II secretory pathway component PulF